MADREAQRKLYAYGEMSNKVQQADRSQLPSRRSADGGTGEAESLWGRLDSGSMKMGDKIMGGGGTGAGNNNGNGSGNGGGADSKGDIESKKRNRPVEVVDRLERAEKSRLKKERKARVGSGSGSGSGSNGNIGGSSSNILMSEGGRSVADMIGDIGGYRPTNTTSSQAHEGILVSYF